MASVMAQAPRNDDGVTTWFMNQIAFVQDADTTDALLCKGDSGSLWFQQGTNAIIALGHGGVVEGPDAGTRATGSRIEDVINQLRIRFA